VRPEGAQKPYPKIRASFRPFRAAYIREARYPGRCPGLVTIRAVGAEIDEASILEIMFGRNLHRREF